MARWQWEHELHQLRFKHYTDSIDRCIQRVVKARKCRDTSDVVLDNLWSKCRADIQAILAAANRGMSSIESIDPEAPLTTMERTCVRAYIDRALTLKAELSELSDDDFEIRYEEEITPIIDAKRANRADKARENDRWAFFNRPDSQVDWGKWLTRLLTPAQATALSLGKDPDIVNPESLAPFRKVGGSLFREDFKEKWHRIELAVSCGDLPKSLTWSSVVEWAGQADFPLLSTPPSEQTTLPGDNSLTWKDRAETAEKALMRLRLNIDELDPKLLGSIYRMLLGMAISRFEYRTDQRSSATRLIREALEFVGLDLKDDAIRSQLSDAAQYLDIQWSIPIEWSGVLKEPKVKKEPSS